MEVVKLLVAGLTMGWGPCLAIQGPILLPYIAATKGGWRSGLMVSSTFSLGRLLALALLGALATIAFASLNRFFPPHRSGYLYLAIAISVVLMGVLVVLGKGFNLLAYRLLERHVIDRGSESMFVLGFLIGISPCAPLIAILTYIGYTATNLVYGIVYALSFGIGTVVATIVLGTLAGFLPGKIFRSARQIKVFRVICGIILILFGLQLIYSVSQLL
jgi:sulfite exporter TauE/SafE